MICDRSAILVRSVQQKNCETAMSELWQVFSNRLMRRVQYLMRSTPKVLMDENDIVTCVFSSFYRALKDQRYTHIRCELDIWRILTKMSERSVIDYRRHIARAKRSSPDPPLSLHDCGPSIVCPRECPELETAHKEQLQLFLNSIEDDRLRYIASAKLLGFTHSEIADSQNCSIRTVERQVSKLRWTLSKITRTECEPE